MTGQRIIMTGGTSGLGKIAALALADKGAELIITSRNLTKEEELKKAFENQYPNTKGSIAFVHCDLSDLKSVKAACQNVLANHTSIDMIINNAGIMNFEEKKSKDGIEETLQVNVLAPALITHLLMPLLEKSKNARIINTASALHKGIIDFENIEHAGKFKSFKTYSQSKLGIILLSRLWAKNLTSRGIQVFSQHPGIVNTELGRSAGWMSRVIFSLMGKSPEKGAETLIYLASEEKSKLETGAYYADKQVKETTPESYNMDTAVKLSTAAYSFLKNYIDSPSLIFEKT